MVSTARVESHLGCWALTNYVPGQGDALEGIVQRVWLFNGTTGPPRERVFPDGTLEIVLQLDAEYRPVDVVPGDPFPALSIGGVRTVALTIEGSGRPVRVLGLRFTPTGACALLRTSLRPLTDLDLDLHDVIGRSAGELSTRCTQARDDASCVAAAVRWVNGLLPAAREPAAFVVRAIAQIEASAGDLAIAELDAIGGRTGGRLAAAFCDCAGVTPKRFARIVRFRRALALVRDTNAPLAEIAGQAGYYDQPHMNAEFRVHAGLTPQALRVAEHYPNSSSIAEQNFQDAAAASA